MTHCCCCCSMKASNYEKVIETAMANATVLNHHISPCEESFIPNVTVYFSFLCLALFVVKLVFLYFIQLSH